MIYRYLTIVYDAGIKLYYKNYMYSIHLIACQVIFVHNNYKSLFNNSIVIGLRCLTVKVYIHARLV